MIFGNVLQTTKTEQLFNDFSQAIKYLNWCQNVSKRLTEQLEKYNKN